MSYQHARLLAAGVIIAWILRGEMGYMAAHYSIHVLIEQPAVFLLKHPFLQPSLMSMPLASYPVLIPCL